MVVNIIIFIVPYELVSGICFYVVFFFSHLSKLKCITMDPTFCSVACTSLENCYIDKLCLSLLVKKKKFPCMFNMLKEPHVVFSLVQHKNRNYYPAG